MQNNTAIVNAEPNAEPLQLPEETEFLIKASIAENTLKAYQRALQSLTAWLSGRILSDAILANYITTFNAPTSPAVPCSDTSTTATTSNQIDSTLTPHAGLSKSGQLMPTSKIFSIPCVSAQRA